MLQNKTHKNHRFASWQNNVQVQKYFQAVTKEKKKRSKGIDKSRIEETKKIRKKHTTPIPLQA